jgi:hypothetical protein
VSLLDIVRPPGIHRAVDKVDRLQHKLARSEAGRTELRRRLTESEQARDTANAKASRLEDAVLAAAVVTQERDALLAELVALRAELATATAVGQLPARDVWPGCEDTQQIQVITLHDAARRGYLR